MTGDQFYFVLFIRSFVRQVKPTVISGLVRMVLQIGFWIGFVVVVVPVLGQCSSCVVWYDDDDVCRSREVPFRCVVVWMGDGYFSGLVWFGSVFCVC